MADSEKTGTPTAMGRRTALTAIGTVGLGLAGAAVAKAATASPATNVPKPSVTTDAASRTMACVLTPEETEGPYYLNYELVRRDITEGYPGVPLLLRVTLVDTTTCAPLRGAALDIWHCDALGEYSGYTAQGVGGTGGGTGPAPTASPTGTPTASPTGMPPGGGHASPTDNLTFLRGVQLTGAAGVGEFETIYPGWYSGRAMHIHVKVHAGGKITRKATYTGGHVAHTGQFYFPEGITEQVAKLDPYKANTVARLRNQDDSIFTAGHGSGLLTLATSRRGPSQSRDGHSHTPGFVATIVVGVNPAATPAPVGN
jgi:protocatechuate 3,4-dioxygenase beta subunit